MASTLLISFFVFSLLVCLSRPTEGVPWRMMIKRRVGIRLPHIAQSLSQKQMASLIRMIALKKTITGYHSYFL